MQFLGASFTPSHVNFNWWISNPDAALDFGPRRAGTIDDLSGRHSRMAVRQHGSDFHGGDDAGDQRRVVTPADAIAGGADYLVIGRSVTGAPDPLAALQRIRDELSGAA
mgnify:CR=1 FL=1